MKVAILYNLRSHYNVGAIFRTADGAGVGHVYLVGYTPSPIDRFGRAVPEIHKTALGAEQAVPWSSVSLNAVKSLINQLQSEGYVVVAVEQTTGSVLLSEFTVPTKVAYIFGSEVEGISEEVVSLVDTVLELPMLGKKESLNVSVTAGIVLYHSQ